MQVTKFFESGLQNYLAPAQACIPIVAGTSLYGWRMLDQIGSDDMGQNIRWTRWILPVKYTPQNMQDLPLILMQSIFVTFVTTTQLSFFIACSHDVYHISFYISGSWTTTRNTPVGWLWWSKPWYPQPPPTSMCSWHGRVQRFTVIDYAVQDILA